MVRAARRGHPRKEKSDQSLYVASGTFMLRAPVMHAYTLANFSRTSSDQAEFPGGEPSPNSLAQQRADGRSALLALATSPRVRQALHVASPDLSAAVGELERRARQGKKVDRSYSALLRYLTRMSTRPTPHGLFAGVAVGTFAARTSVVLNDDPVLLTRTRADTAWLHTVIEAVEGDEQARDRLPVRVNDLLYRAGGYVVLFRPDVQPERAGDRVEIRLTPPIEIALDLAKANPVFGDLVAGLVGRFPATRQERIRALLNRLWDLRILQSDLQPPLNEPRPEQYLLERLTNLDVSPDVVLGLQKVRRLSGEVDQHKGVGGTAKVEMLSAHQREMSPGFAGSTYRQDTALAVTAELSEDIASAAAEAVQTMMRLGCVRTRAQHIVQYHEEFLENYGMNAELPLLEVLRPETGLGPPNGYHAPPRQLQLPARAEPPDVRNQALVELMAHASRHRIREVELDDNWFDELAVWSPDDPRCLPRTSLDLYFQIAAESTSALSQGRWSLVLSVFGYTGGIQSFGRFFHLFDEAAVAMIRDHSRAEEELRPDTVFAELNYHAHGWLGSNVAVHPGVRAYEIAVNLSPTLPSDRQIMLDDIVLGANSDHFYLRSTRLGKRLSVSQSHARSSQQAPNVCRALLEFSADGFTQGAAFDWGVLHEAPFLPRLTRGRTVVHPAKWTITRTTFSDTVASPDAFFRACQRWRKLWNVPRYVYLTDFDNRLLLDLEHPLWVDELHREVERQRRGSWSRSIALHEALPGPQELWLRDRAGRPFHSEITVPFRLREPHQASAAQAAPTLAVTRRWLPGDKWIHLKLYSAPEQHDAIIGGLLHSFLQEIREAGLIDQWFYIRYSDPFPHLRLRFRASSIDRIADLMLQCATWGRHLVEDNLASDLAFTSYDREIERYGGPHAIDTLETVFWRNSDVSADLVRLVHGEPAKFDIELVSIASIHALYRSWGSPPSVLLHLRDPVPSVSDAARRRFRELRPLLCEVLAPGEFRPDARAADYRAALLPILERQHDAIRDAGTKVRRLSEQGLLIGKEENILQSLEHIQLIRILGVDRDRELRCRDLWMLALRAVRGRLAAGDRGKKQIGVA